MKDPLEKLIAGLIASGKLEPSGEPGSPRARIAQAALELFAERSYEAATTKEIAARARTTERTLFKQFTSKEELFATTVFPAFIRALLPVLHGPSAAQGGNAPDDFRAVLRVALVERIEAAVENPALFTMVWRELLSRPAFRSAFMKLFVQSGGPALDQIIAGARKRNEIRGLPGRVILTGILGPLVGYLVTRLLLAPKEDWDTEADAEEMLDVIFRGIGPTVVPRQRRR